MHEDRIQNHCQITGKYLGAAHFDCVINSKFPFHLPIFIPNLHRHNLHWFIKKIWPHIHPTDKLEILTPSNEKNISLSLKILIPTKSKYLELRFMDINQTLPCSLENMASLMQKNSFIETTRSCGHSNLDIILRKGIQESQFMDAFKKLKEFDVTDKVAFFSSLTTGNVSSDDIENAEKIWHAFDIKTCDQYLDIYLKRNVLLLCDVIEKMRIVYLNIYGLDPAHYYNISEYSWDAMLKYTEIKLELITDISIIQFIQNGIRGAVSICPNRHAIANNKFTLSECNSDKPSSFLINLKANNLYDWVMTQPLPFEKFRWLSDSEIKTLRVETLDADTSVGYILEVDLSYPVNLHNNHNDFPFCAEQITSHSFSRLVPTLNDKTKYIIYHKNLIQCLAHGLQLKSIHRVLKFNQLCFVEKYIFLNNTLLTQPNCHFEKKLYQFLNDSLLEILIENPNDYTDTKLCSSWHTLNNYNGPCESIALPFFNATKILNENLVMVESKLSEIVLNKPYYLGFCIQELAKLRIYDFHYNFLKKVYKDNVKLLYTDNDQLIYEIKTENLYTDMLHSPWFDTSNYLLNASIPERKNQKQGAFKDLLGGRNLLEFVGLKSKLYAIKYTNEKSAALKQEKSNTLNSEHLIEFCSMQRFQALIKIIDDLNSSKHPSNAKDNKRFIDPVSKDNRTYAFGHCEIKNHLKQDKNSTSPHPLSFKGFL